MVLSLRRVAGLVVVVSSVSSAACEKSEGTGATPSASASAALTPAAKGSCDRVSTMSVCSEYAPAQLAKDTAVLTAQCTKLGGTYVAAGCPNTAVLGSCTLGTGEVRTFYASGGAAYDAARAAKECSSLYSGTWKPF